MKYPDDFINTDHSMTTQTQPKPKKILLLVDKPKHGLKAGQIGYVEAIRNNRARIRFPFGSKPDVEIYLAFDEFTFDSPYI